MASVGARLLCPSAALLAAAAVRAVLLHAGPGPAPVARRRRPRRACHGPSPANRVASALSITSLTYGAEICPQYLQHVALGVLRDVAARHLLPGVPSTGCAAAQGRAQGLPGCPVRSPTTPWEGRRPVRLRAHVLLALLRHEALGGCGSKQAVGRRSRQRASWGTSLKVWQHIVCSALPRFVWSIAQLQR